MKPLCWEAAREVRVPPGPIPPPSHLSLATVGLTPGTSFELRQNFKGSTVLQGGGGHRGKGGKRCQGHTSQLDAQLCTLASCTHLRRVLGETSVGSATQRGKPPENFKSRCVLTKGKNLFPLSLCTCHRGGRACGSALGLGRKGWPYGGQGCLGDCSAKTHGRNEVRKGMSVMRAKGHLRCYS